MGHRFFYFFKLINEGGVCEHHNIASRKNNGRKMKMRKIIQNNELWNAVHLTTLIFFYGRRKGADFFFVHKKAHCMD